VPPCGRCDRCQSRGVPIDWSAQAAQVLTLLQERRGLDLPRLADDLADHSGAEDTAAAEGERWGWLARRLVQEELISESDDGSQRLWIREAGRRYLEEPWPLRWAA